MIKNRLITLLSAGILLLSITTSDAQNVSVTNHEQEDESRSSKRTSSVLPTTCGERQLKLKGVGYTEALQLDVETPTEITTAGELPWILWSAAAPDSNGLLTCTWGWNAAEARSSLNAYVSLDRGRTWQRTLQDRTSPWMSETSCAFGPDGTAYVVTGASKQTGITRGHSYGVMHVWRSSDSGLTWQGPTIGPFIDWTSIAVDVTGGPRRGSVYLFGNDIALEDGKWAHRAKLLRTSKDRGLTFGSTVFAPGKERGWPKTSMVLRDGTAVALYNVGYDNVIVTSSDGGQSLSVLPPIPRDRVITSVRGSELAVDQSGGRFDGRFYVAYPAMRAGTPGIMLAISDDRGRTWRTGVAVALTLPSKAGVRRVYADIAVNRDGVVGLTWYEPQTECKRFAISTDGGKTFANSVALSRCVPTRPTSTQHFEHHLWTMGFYEVDGHEYRRTPGISVRLEPVIPNMTQLTVDADGRFHPFWVERRSDGRLVLLTTSITLERVRNPKSSEVPPITPITTDGFVDVTEQVIIDITGQHYDSDRGTYTIHFTLTSKVPLVERVRIRISDLQSGFGFGRAEVLGAANWICGSGAIFDVTGSLVNGRLDPGVASGPIPITFRVKPLVDPGLIWQRMLESGKIVHPISARLQIYAWPSKP